MKKKNIDYFYPICGIDDTQPLCYFLRFEGFNILLDCGIPLTEPYKQKLADISKNLDIVLLSHCTYQHICGLPYLFDECGCEAKIYSTTPTVRMGEMTLYDYVLNKNMVSETNVDEELNKIDTAFKSINELQYTESFVIKSEDNEQVITIQPFNAGYSLGGTVWKITNEIDSLVYCVDFDIRNSHYLSGVDLNVFNPNPTLLILDCKNLQKKKSTQELAKKIKENVIETLVKNNGNVLMPTDSSGRSLELICVLEELWRNTPKLQQFDLFFLSGMSYRTVKTFASQQIQYMNSLVIKNFNEGRANPFNLQHCKLIQEFSSISENNPCVVITTDSTMEFGNSREVFLKFTLDPKNLILITEKPTPRSLSNKIVTWIQTLPGKQFPTSTTLTVKRKEPLKGKQLQEYKLQKQLERESELKKKQEEEQRKKIVRIKDEDEHEDDENEDNDTNMLDKHDDDPKVFENDKRLFLPVNMLYRSPFLMFPPKQEDKFQSDDYGDIIDVQEMKQISLKMLESDTLDTQPTNPNNPLKVVPHDGTPNKTTKKKDEIPLQVVSQQITIPLKCKFLFINMDGRCTGDSMQNMLQKVKPRQLILINGKEIDKLKLAKFVRNGNITQQVANPVSSVDRLDIMTETVLFRVTLSADFIKLSDMAFYKDFEISFFEGKYEHKEDQQNEDTKSKEEEEEEKNSTKNDAMDVDKSKKFDPIITRRKDNLGHEPIFIGNIKLNEFKDTLNKKGIFTQFKIGGGVICNNRIMIQKDMKTEKVKITGPLCNDYFVIRDVLYKQFNIL